MDVVLVRWPAEADRRSRLREAGTPRLLLVEDGPPPTPDDCREDWIRVPADDADVRARMEAVTARVAQQVGGEQILDLEAPRGDMVLTDGGWVHVSADTGRYDRPRHHLDLAGDVTIHHDNGMTLRTAEAAVAVEAVTASGDAPVAAQGPFGTLESEGFRLKERGAVVVFTGRAHAVLEGGPE